MIYVKAKDTKGSLFWKYMWEQVSKSPCICTCEVCCSVSEFINIQKSDIEFMFCLGEIIKPCIWSTIC